MTPAQDGGAARKQATCRGCGKLLRGDAYMYGGDAYDPQTGKRAKVNQYGGFVCSYRCDYRASVEMHSSMPGCNGARTPDTFAMQRIRSNWPEESRR